MANLEQVKAYLIAKAEQFETNADILERFANKIPAHYKTVTKRIEVQEGDLYSYISNNYSREYRVRVQELSWNDFRRPDDAFWRNNWTTESVYLSNGYDKPEKTPQEVADGLREIASLRRTEAQKYRTEAETIEETATAIFKAQEVLETAKQALSYTAKEALGVKG